MAWLQITFHTTADTAELISIALSEAGALSISMTDAADDPVYEPARHTTPLWNNTHVTALFEEESDSETIKKYVQALINPLPPYTLEKLEDREWTRVWMDRFQPQQFGQKLWICPSWLPIPDPNALNILLDPGLAFGTGTHPTTALCLEWLDAQRDLTHYQVLDYGCGSGILALAAAKLGAKTLWAVDNDPQAITATQENAQRNGITYIQTYLPEEFPTIQADLVIANILANTLIDLKPTLLKSLKINGILLLSGILAEQASSVQTAYSPDCIDFETVQREDWVRITARKCF